jgi:hypothetical protein
MIRKYSAGMNVMYDSAAIVFSEMPDLLDSVTIAPSEVGWDCQKVYCTIEPRDTIQGNPQE